MLNMSSDIKGDAVQGRGFRSRAGSWRVTGDLQVLTIGTYGADEFVIQGYEVVSAILARRMQGHLRFRSSVAIWQAPEGEILTWLEGKVDSFCGS